jgi:hypothetical protein
MTLRLPFLSLFLASCFLSSQVTWAFPPVLKQPKPGVDLPQGFAPPGRRAPDDETHDELSANAAAQRAQAINGGGRVLSVEETRGGWRVKLLKEGDVRFVFVPD